MPKHRGHPRVPPEWSQRTQITAALIQTHKNVLRKCHMPRNILGGFSFGIFNASPVINLATLPRSPYDSITHRSASCITTVSWNPNILLEQQCYYKHRYQQIHSVL